MGVRPRISVTLHEPWSVYLAWYAGEVGELPAEVARGLIETGLERTRADPDLRRRYDAWLGRGGDDPGVMADVALALQVDGVPHILSDMAGDASPDALHAARYLGLVSIWLADERPATVKGPPPRLADVLATATPRKDVGRALAYAGDADGRTVRQGRTGGRLEASDKHALSDTAPSGAGGVRNEWT